METNPSKSPRKDPTINALALTIFATNIGGGIILAIIALYTKHLNISLIFGGWVISLFAIARGITQPIIGHYIDRIDPRPVITCGIVIFIVASAAPAIPNAVVLYVARALQGVGSALVIVSCYTIIARRYLDAYMRRIANARFMMLEMTGSVLGPLVGAVVFWVTDSFSSPFIVCSMFGVIAMALYMKNYGAIGGSKPLYEMKDNPHKKNKMVFNPSGLSILILISTMFFVLQFVWGSLQFIMPLYVVNKGMPGHFAGLFFGALSFGMILTILLTEREAFGKTPAELLIFVGSFFALSCLTLLVLIVDVWVWFLLFWAMGAGVGLLFPIFPSLAADAIKDRPGQGVSYMEMGGNLGFIIGPVAAGALAAGEQYLRAFYFEIGSAYFLIAVAVALIVIRWRLKKRADVKRHDNADSIPS
ncbi:MAG: MFS transporter [Deltaproteobacteria bacterium]|uniref:MFS transporter n=1 Tax=Candidatus Zymogenus saltonus TaxID=2844893 RepID=A0A9D8PQZ1_9DELT|nr:MFS transporter [Candidatus Zymogenus saltonus]